MTTQLIKLTEAMAKRVRRAEYVFEQDRCLICGLPFLDCPHDISQNERVVALVTDKDGFL